MRTRDWVVAGAGAGLLLLAGAAYPLATAQGTATVAVIDNDRLFAESEPGKAANAQLEQSISTLQGGINQTEQELSEMQQRRQAQAATLNAEALAQLDAEIEQKRLQLQRMREDAQREFNRLRDQVIGELTATLTPLVEELAEESGYQIIFNTQTPGLLYYADAIDVTDQLIVKANQTGTGS